MKHLLDIMQLSPEELDGLIHTALDIIAQSIIFFDRPNLTVFV